MATKTKQDRTSREGVELAIQRLVEQGLEEFTTAQVQSLAAKLAPAVKDGYAGFWLTKFNQQGLHVERVKRGTYRPIDVKPAPSADELAEQHTAKELRELAEREGVQVARSATKKAIIEKLVGAAS